ILASSFTEVGEVGKAVAAPGRRAAGEKSCIRRTNSRRRFGRKRKPAGFDIACNERVQARLEDRDLPALELPDLRRIPIDTGYVVPEIGKTSAGHEPDVAGTDHCYSHEVLPGVLPLAGFCTRSNPNFLRRYGSRDCRIRRQLGALWSAAAAQNGPTLQD